ncbi:MAG: mannose-6-phosphate isomerase, class I [Lachnospiraceae bacterium]|nr:mannose-6-phosphate isomerase, class I [Lachnospiraceae bacterium]
MTEILLLKPEFKSMIWGGNKMRSMFNYEIPTETTGECWAVSAHKAGDCTIDGGEFDGKKLSFVYATNRELFNCESEVFPLLTKIIDAKDDLSVQVHPDDEYAKINENGSLGKTECWYIVDCEEGADIVIGHNAKDKKELEMLCNEGRFDELIRKLPLKKGDFFQIDSGTVHAIRKGTVILETQQSSDITYRLYDYGRLQNGKPRELHLQKSIDVIKCPYEAREEKRIKEKLASGEIETLVCNDFYTVRHFCGKGIAENEIKTNDTFTIVSVLEGKGTLKTKSEELEVKKGMHFILTNAVKSFTVSGDIEMIISNPMK